VLLGLAGGGADASNAGTAAPSARHDFLDKPVDDQRAGRAVVAGSSLGDHTDTNQRQTA
jgi:hypothetical protein